MMIRQGDVLMIPVNGLPKDATREPKDPRGLVVANGETSGHHHAIFGRGARLLRRSDGQRYAVVGLKGATIETVGGGSGAGVPRHDPISLSPGVYEIRIQRSYVSDEYAPEVQD